MRSVTYAAACLLTMATCLPAVAEPAIEQHAPVQSADATAFGRAVDTGALDGYRAGTETLNSMRPEGWVDNNTASHVITGMNTVKEGAFTNASGLPTLIQNSGTNVLIQNATIVNMKLQ